MNHFYTQCAQKHLTHLFPKTVSYKRFAALMQSVNLPLAYVCKNSMFGQLYWDIVC